MCPETYAINLNTISSNIVFSSLPTSTAAWSSKFGMVIKPWLFKGDNRDFDKTKLFWRKQNMLPLCKLLQKHHKKCSDLLQFYLYVGNYTNDSDWLTIFYAAYLSI